MANSSKPFGVFRYIKTQIINQQAEKEFLPMGMDCSTNSFVFKNDECTNILDWLEDNGVLKILDVKIIDTKGYWHTYEVYYEDLNIEAPFFRYSNIAGRKTQDTYEYNGSQYVSESEYFNDETKYEKIDPADATLTDYVVYKEGCSSYEELLQKREEEFGKENAKDELYEELKERIKEISAPEYSYAEEYEVEV